MGLSAFNRMRRLRAEQTQQEASVDETKAQKPTEALRTALTAAGIEFAPNAKKAELQALYEASLSHDA